MKMKYLDKVTSLLPLVICLASATPYVGFPFDQQLPDIGRAGSPFSFSLSNITYESSDGQVTYTASNLPAWLSFDASSRTFSGTPQFSDISEFTITLTGYDSTGSISNDYSLIVTDEPAPILTSDTLFDQLIAYGETNGVDGIVIAPGDSFSIKVSKDTFAVPSGANDSIVAYYGRSSDRTSLPNWVGFDDENLIFEGIAPVVNSNVAPSVQYSFSFIASDIAGFTGVESQFKIIVGAHQFSTTINSTIKINGTSGSTFEVQVPLGSILEDGNTVTTANISTAYIQNNPSYITFDNTNYSISGTFPNNTASESFQVVFYDIHGNDVIIPYEMDSYGSLFTVNNLDSVNATKGEFFQYQLLKSYFTDYDDTTVSVDFSNADWLTYHDSNLTFNGDVPSDFSDLQITVEASTTNDKESKALSIKGINTITISSSSASSSATYSSSSSTSSGSVSSATSSAAAVATTSSSTIPVIPAKSNEKSSNSKKGLAIGLGVGIPVGLIAVAAIIFCCCFAAKKRKGDDSEKGDNISRPIPPAHGTGALTYSPEKLYPANSNEFDESPKQLSTLNVLKLDKKKENNTDVNSTSSSTTHVDSFEDFHPNDEDELGDTSGSYYDAENRSIETLDNEIPGQPRKSWRTNNLSTTNHIKRDSDGSLATVSTEQLFSVRLVENEVSPGSNNDNRNSSYSTYSQVLSNTNSMILRDDSGNIQRLDSDGNIIDNFSSSTPVSNSNYVNYNRRDSKALSNLDVLHEESSPQLSENSVALPNIKTTPESNDLSFPQSNNSFVDEFKHHETSQGEIKWSRASPKLQSESTSEILTEQDISDLKKLKQEEAQFYFQSPHSSSISNPLNLSNQKLNNLSAISVTSNQVRDSTKSASTAKLVEFSGKGSLRSSFHDIMDHQYESAEVYHSDYD